MGDPRKAAETLLLIEALELQLLKARGWQETKPGHWLAPTGIALATRAGTAVAVAIHNTRGSREYKAIRAARDSN